MKRITSYAVVCLTAITAVLATSHAEAMPRTHDGFYLGLEGGFGYLSSSAKANGVDLGKYSGLTLDSALWLGGTVGPVVIGGGFYTAQVLSPKVTFQGQDVSSGVSSMYLVGIGPFVDVYPDPNDGLHFMGFVGWGGLESSRNGNVGGSDPTGLVTMLGGGYEFWVADQWSIGPLARLTYAPLSMSGADYSTLAFALVADIKYH
ncbi:MAG TPA: hypothetical protein VIV60_04880 [Polyangiaceae bacterium]